MGGATDFTKESYGMFDIAFSIGLCPGPPGAFTRPSRFPQ
jgi:hypothetical protein